MSGLKYYERTKRIIKLIRNRSTGSPKELAGKLDVSERTIYRLMEDLRLTTGKNVVYSYLHESYVFKEKPKFNSH